MDNYTIELSLENLEEVLNYFRPKIYSLVSNLEYSSRDDFIQELQIKIYKVLGTSTFMNINNIGKKINYINVSLNREYYRLTNLYLDNILYLDREYEGGFRLLDTLRCTSKHYSKDFFSVSFFEQIKDELTDREIQIINWLFFENKTEYEVSILLNYTQQNISYIKKNTLRKIKRKLEELNHEQISK